MLKVFSVHINNTQHKKKPKDRHSIWQSKNKTIITHFGLQQLNVENSNKE